MDFNGLLELLEIESPEELQYFEQFAELVETDEELDGETLHSLFLDVNTSSLNEVLEGYFDELLRAVPDDETELYTLMEAIKTYMLGIIASESGDDFANLFTDEFLRFKAWYKDDRKVLCQNSKDDSETAVTMMEALNSALLQGMTDDRFNFDFTDALGFEIDEYIVPVAKLQHDYAEFDDEYDLFEDEEEDAEAGFRSFVGEDDFVDEDY